MKTLSISVLMLMSVFGLIGKTVADEIPVERQDVVERGKWYNGFYSARWMAEGKNTPFLSFAGKSGCSHCADCEAAMATEHFLIWQEKANIYMGMAIAGDTPLEYMAAVNFAKEPMNIKAELPYLCLYWKKADGTILKYNFCGQKKEIPSSGDTLAEALVNFLTNKLNEWGYVPPQGGKFDCGNTIGDRLEAQEGYTTFVDVPVVREEGADTSIADTFTATFPDATTFSTNLVWNEGELTKDVRVAIPESAKAGDVIALTLEAEGNVETSAITIVNRENSPKNPTWRGVSDFGEWTLDLAAAQTFAANARNDGSGKPAYVLALLAGSLWCPDCARTDAYLVDTPAFADWAKSNRVVCVAVDIPNFSASAPTTGPCLLTRATKEVSQSYLDADPEHGAVQSGAGYLSRWMISDEEASAQLATNRELVSASTEDGGLNRPERTNRYRTGVPVFAVVNADGSVAARIETFATKSPGAFMAGYINRLDEMLAAADVEGTEDNVHEGTTTETMSSHDGTYSATVSGGDLTDVIELVDVDDTARTHLDVTATIPDGLGLSVSLLQVIGTNSTVVTNALLRRDACVARLSADFAAPNGDARYFAKVALTGLEADENAAKFGYDGDATTSYSLAGSTEQIPGEIKFAQAAQSVFVPDGRGVVTVQRVGGRSGAATVRVYVKDAGDAAGLYDFPETNLVWAAGETDAKSVSFDVGRGDALASGSFTLALEAVGETDVAVSDETHVVTLTDTDKPCFENFDIELEPYSGFTLSETIELRNVQAGVAATVKKTSGSLPSGVTLKYDKKTGSVVLSGTPKMPGTYTVTYTVTQNRVTGLPATLTFTVADPKALNERIGVARTSQAVPLLGETEDGETILEGTLTVSVTAKNRITAKHVGLYAKSTSYSGYWQTIDEAGDAIAELTARDGSTLLLEMDGDGVIYAEIPDFDVSGSAAWPTTSFARWAGHYTLTFPTVAEVDEESEATTGTPTALVDVTANGKVKWTLTRSDGTRLSGSTTLVATDDEDVAVAALFKNAAKVGFAAYVEIGADGATAWDKSTGAYAPQIVHDAEGTVAYELLNQEMQEPRYAFGSWYKAGVAPTTLSETFGYSGDYVFYSPALGEKTLRATAKGFSLVEADKTFKFAFVPKTGLFSGTAKVANSAGKLVSAKFTGVLMPGWDECGACVEGFTAYERPFGSGTLTYKDNGATVSLPVTLTAIPAGD